MHTAAPETAISVRGLRKRYGDIDAVRGVDLDIACRTAPTPSQPACRAVSAAGSTSPWHSSGTPS